MTMKTPEMEVVRFNESDVIVASGPVVDNNFYATTAGWGGTTGGASLKIVQNNVVLEDYDWNRIKSGEASHLINNDINFDGLTLGKMYEDEVKENPQYDAYNGEWISGNGIDYTRFVRQ